MHRIIPFAVLLFSIAPLPALAQEAGLHFTVARTSLSESDNEAGPATRVGGGISVDFPFTDNAGFRTGIFYARKGMQLGDELPVSGGTYFDYLELPALLRIGIPVEGQARPYLLLGPSLAISVGCSIEVSAAGSEISQDCDDVVPIRRLDPGLTGGAGIALTSEGGVSFRLDALYSLGLRAVADDGGSDKNRAITGQVGIAFPIG